METTELVNRIIELSFEKKAHHVVKMDLRGLSDVADYFILMTGDSDVQIRTLAGHIEGELRDEGARVWKREGLEQLNWVLLDYVEVVVHIFRPEIREYYDIERLWADAEITEVEDHA